MTSLFGYLRPAMVLLMVLTLGGAVYLIYITAAAYQESNDGVVSAAPPVTPENPAPETLRTVDSSLLLAIQGRDLFSSAPAKAAEDSVVLEQLPPHLKVVGIVIAATPQVIIEDTSADQTYFVAQGRPDGGISLRHADRQRVILDYHGQNISLPVTQLNQGVNANVSIP